MRKKILITSAALVGFLGCSLAYAQSEINSTDWPLISSAPKVSVVAKSDWPLTSEVAAINWPRTSIISQEAWPVLNVPTMAKPVPSTAHVKKQLEQTGSIVGMSGTLPRHASRTYAKSGAMVLPVNSPNSKSFSLPYISNVHTTGVMNYYITVGGRSNYMTVQGDPLLLAGLNYQVKGGYLNLYYPDKQSLKHIVHLPKEALEVNLHLVSLSHLNQMGISNVSINDLTTQPLYINKWGSGSLVITGPSVKLFELDNAGAGSVNINHINSNLVVVNDNGQGPVSLTGPNVGLQQLSTHESGLLTIGTVKTANLNITANSRKPITLTGVMTVGTINFSGSGSLKIYWIKSNNLTLHTFGRGLISLAGVAKVLNADAHDYSHINLRYLRVGNAYVKTWEDAIADIYAVNNLYAYANQNSNIYYYHQPGYISRMSNQAGSILPMWDIPNAILGFNQNQPTSF